MLEGTTHCGERAGREQRVGVDREDDVAVDHRKGGIEGDGLATARQAEPPQAGDSRAVTGLAGLRCGEAVKAQEDGGGVVVRTIVSNQDEIGRISLCKERFNGCLEDRRFVVGGNDDGGG